jgi:DNA mismatch endonuclease (patch repair protein)
MRKQRRERTRPEEAFAEFLTRRGYRVERNVSDLPGRPDIVLPRRAIVIFVHGCFWHGCPRHGTIPKNNRAFWSEKIEANRTRDRRKSARLRRLGWHVLTVWEHDEPESCLARVRRVAGRRR